MHSSLLAVALAATATHAELVGYYSWNWGSGSQGPPGANMGIAFTGLVDLDKAIAQYTPGAAWCCPELKGKKVVTVGGGNGAGTFNVANINKITAGIGAVQKANYTGIIFDVEEVSGPAADVNVAFGKAFAAAKKAGLTVAITMSHSAPYACDTPADAVAMVKAWAADTNVDILSPQLYSSGSEAKPEFAETNSCVAQGCTWDLYAPFKGVFAPSIVDAAQYDEVKSFFAKKGIPTGGFIEWRQRA
eukprot:TRINITY_DN193_c0_g1_i1.p1 TRINITY_DN193_c0_g1~~TRINITY_DN193_c0_g1_i1.p1  ORF type:complete len:246 (+),score=89.48 TRINITY_DN193_c0_g1_i1:53-790(+)